ncbi:unnamed protein product [Blepharisma stoltei]|uniref:Receptor ligand binding region domain-containing protein n=1 Tax=Blepharisma stoltei TaxID=1481888 RepID=A0AAU9I785_9CILI|nr:unnamed protein product [Blepharisma stoltei]
MKSGLFYSLIFQIVHSQLLVDLYYGAETDLELKSYIRDKINQNYQNQIEVRESLISSVIDLNHFTVNPNIIVDLTFSASILAYIKDFVAENHIILILLQDLPNSYNDWQFFSHSSLQDHENALSCLVSFFNWEEFLIISSNLGQNFHEIFSVKKFNIFHFSETSDKNLVDLFVGKRIKPTGIRNLIILNQGETANKLLQSLENKNIIKSGSGVILGSRSSWDTKVDGVITYIESGLENATDYYSYEALSILKILDLVLSFSDCSNSLALRAFLESNTVNHYLPGNFTVINIQNSQKVNIGSISQGSLTISSNPIFPGNSTLIPNSPYTNISLWMGDGPTNPLGFPDSPFIVVKDGAKYAFKTAEDTHFFDGFKIVLTHIDCGAEVYVPAFSLDCYKKLVNEPGFVYMPHPWPIVTLGDIISMRELNITIPIVTEHVALGTLSNKTEYPLFMRIAGNDFYRCSVLADLMIIFGWKNVLIVTENTTASLLTYFWLKKRMEAANINIANKPEEMMIMENYNHDFFNNYKDLMIGLLKYKTRPIIFTMAPPASFYFLEDMYNVGIRRGDLIIMFPNKIAFAYTTIPIKTMLDKMTELLYGGITINEAEWLGEFGQNQLKGFLKVYPNINADFRCFSIDAGWLVLNALKFTIDQGEDIYDPYMFNTHLRQQRFLGCSGIVSISSQSNDRNSAPIGIYNFRYDSEHDILYEQMVGAYDQGSLQLFTFYEDMNWYDNTTNIPSDIVKSENGCPFKDSQIEYSVHGAGVLYGIAFGIAVSTMFITFYIWKRWWNVEIRAITEPKLIQFEDYIAMLIILLDFLQFLSVGPDIKNYDIFTYTLTHFASITFMTQGKYLWIHLYFAIGGVCAWLLFGITHIFRIGENSNNSFLNYWKMLSKISLPILGNALFLPLVSVFLNAIQCDQQIGSKLTDTFVRKDCNTFCWKDEHILWASLSMACLILYLPLAIYFRPFWDYYESFINIKTRPLFLMVKSVFQVSIIVLNKTVKPQSQALHGLSYSALLCVLIFICIKKKPYNESRMNLWQIISYLAILWSVVLSSLYWIIPTKIMEAWILSEYLGWIILIIVGLYIQKLYCPTMLFNEPGINVVKLFRFSLGKSIEASEINKDLKEQGIKYSLHLSSSRMFLDVSSSAHQAIYGKELKVLENY